MAGEGEGEVKGEVEEEKEEGSSCVTNAINAKKDSPTNGDKEIKDWHRNEVFNFGILITLSI